MSVSSAALIANAATRSAIEGSSFERNIIAAIPDIVGQALGGVLGDVMKGGSKPSTSEPDPVIIDQVIQDMRNPLPVVGWDAGIGLEPGPPPSLDEELALGEALGIYTPETVAIHRAMRDNPAAKIVEEQNAIVAAAESPSTSRYQSAEFKEAYGSSLSSYSISNTEWLRRDAEFRARRDSLGPNPTDKQKIDIENYERDLAGDRANLDAALAKADRQIIDIIGSVWGGVDFAKGAWRLYNGEVNIENTLSVGFGILGSLGGVAKPFFRGGGKVVAESVPLGKFDSSPYITNDELVQSIATRADRIGKLRRNLGTGPVAGTAKHDIADVMLTRYQRMFGDRGLSTEVRYIDGLPWEAGMPTKGSIRLDVVEGPRNMPTKVWDYKFGSAKLSQSRITQIQNGIPNRANVPVLEIKP